MSVQRKLEACKARLDSPFAGERAAAEGRIRALCQGAGLSPAAYGLAPEPGAPAAGNGHSRAAMAAAFLNWAEGKAEKYHWRDIGGGRWSATAEPNHLGWFTPDWIVDDTRMIAMAEDDWGPGGKKMFECWIRCGMRTSGSWSDVMREAP